MAGTDSQPPHIAAHAHSSRNRSLILAAQACGCFHCLRTFSATDLTEDDWVPERDGDATALCPFCGIDAVIAEAPDLPITPGLLQAMQAHWFGS